MMENDLLYFGLTHRTAPLALREAFRADRDKAREMYHRLSTVTVGTFLLSTCERFELYAVASAKLANEWPDRLSTWFHVPCSLVRTCTRALATEAAARHLLRVAAGLDSRILGEPHILGQVREAYACALDAHSLDPILAALGRFALRTGKRVRHETNINASRRSIVTVALERLRAECNPWRAKTTLIVGSGTLAEDILARLQNDRRPPNRVLICGRNQARADHLAKRMEASAVPWGELPYAVAQADAILTATASMTYVLDAGSITAAMLLRPARPLCLFDLGMPRNIDPVVAQIPNIRRFDLDALLARSVGDLQGLAAAERIVEEEVTHFLRWRHERNVAPIIAAWMERAGGRRGLLPLPARRRLHQRIMRLKAEAVA